MTVEAKSFMRIKWVCMHSRKLKETDKWSVSLKHNMPWCGFILFEDLRCKISYGKPSLAVTCSVPVI